MNAPAPQGVCRVAGAEAGRFPVLERMSGGSKRAITLIGFTHGHGGEFLHWPTEAKAAVADAVSRFKQDDYVLAEGYDDSLAAKAFEKVMNGRKLGHKPKDHVDAALLAAYPRLRFSERFEWFTLFPGSKEELSVIHAIDAAKADGRLMDATEAMKKFMPEKESREALKQLFECTFITREEANEIKEAEIRGTVERTGLPENAVRFYMEGRTTLRSCIAARTALWRSELMDVKLFMGVLHSGEMVEFLTDPEAAARYVAGLPEGLKRTYENNEFYQSAITGEFRGFGLQALSRRLFPIFLRWVAYRVYDAEYGLNPGACFDFSDYRKTVMGIMQGTGRNDPCFCFSGKKFKNCCGPLSDALRAIGA